jgi:hypothetical protein
MLKTVGMAQVVGKPVLQAQKPEFKRQSHKEEDKE